MNQTDVIKYLRDRAAQLLYAARCLEGNDEPPVPQELEKSVNHKIINEPAPEAPEAPEAPGDNAV